MMLARPEKRCTLSRFASLVLRTANSFFVAGAVAGFLLTPTAQAQVDGLPASSNLLSKTIQAIPSPKGVAIMWPSLGQTSGAWNVVNPYGCNPNTAIACSDGESNLCSGTTTQCWQEFINYAAKEGYPAEVDCQGVHQFSQQTGTIQSGQNTITGLNASSLFTGMYVVGVGANAGDIPSFTQITVSGSTVTMSNNATGNATLTLTFSLQYYGNMSATSGITVPPVENWYFDAKGCNITFATSVTAPGFSFDSMMASHFYCYCVIVYQPATQVAGEYAVYFGPANPVPEDGYTLVTASDIFFANPTANSNAAAVVGINVGASSISTGFGDNKLGFVEVNGGTYGIQVYGPGSSSQVFDNNIITAPNIHGQVTAGITEGINTTNQSALYGNIWNVSVQSNSGVVGIQTYGVHDTFHASVSGGNYSLNMETGSAANGQLTSISASSGGIEGTGAFTGAINSTMYGASTAGATCSGSPDSSFTVKNGVPTAC